MALKRPALIGDSTTTTGTGTYTLDDDVAPGAGLRTLADAVTDGDVANTDTVYYWVVDITTEGAALEWEHGIGTVGASGITLARTTIIESSNGDAAVSWGSGTRTVRIGIGLDGLALLAAAQTFTALQTFSGGLTSTGATAVDGGGSLGRMTVRSNLASGTPADVLLQGKNSAAAFINYALIRANILDGTAASEDSSLSLLLYAAGAQVTPITFKANGTITDNIGARDFAYQGVLSAPASTRLLLGNNVLPAGWSIVASLADKTILTTSTVSEIDDQAGSWTISGLTNSATAVTIDGTTATIDSTTLANNQIPGVTGSGGGLSGVLHVSDGTSIFGVTSHGHTSPSHAHTSPSHDHTISSDAGWRPAYYKAGWIVKS